MEKVLVVIVAVFSNLCLEAQLYPFENNGSWGYQDNEGNVVVDATFQRAFDFSEGFGIVMQNNLYGFIDGKGQEVTAVKYNRAFNFTEGMAIVNIGCEWGIDSEGRNICYGGTWGFINTAGEEIAMEYDKVTFFSEGVAYGEKILNIAVYGDQESVDSIMAEARKTTGWFMIDKQGNRMNAEGFEDTHGVSLGLSPVKRSGKWSYINTQGEQVTDFIYDDARTHADNGLARVLKDGKWGFIDANCEVVIDMQYDSVAPMEAGLAVVWNDDKCGIITQTGTVFAPIQYDYIGYSEAQKLIVLFADEGIGFMDKNGKQVTPLIYEAISYGCGDLKYPNFFNDGTLAVKKDGKWGFVDENGKVIIPCKYDWVHEFREGLAAVSIGDNETEFKTGFIDMTGKTIIPFDYENVWWNCDHSGGFYNGLAAVVKEGKWGFIDKTGRLKIPYQYDAIYWGPGFINDGKDGPTARVLVGDREFFIDTNGNEVE